MIKSYTFHPVSRTLEHVDFVEVKLDRAVDVEIPLVATGKPIGVANGGILRQVYRTLPVRCLPDRIPLKIEVDVSHLDIDESIHAEDLKLPEGVEFAFPAEQTLIAVVAPEKDCSEEEAAAAAGAAAAAAPAAGAAPARRRAPRLRRRPAAGAAREGDKKKKRRRRTPRRSKRQARPRASLLSASRRRARQSGQEIRTEPAQRRLHGRRASSRGRMALADFKEKFCGVWTKGEFGGEHARTRRAAQAADVHEPVRRLRSARRGVPQGRAASVIVVHDELDLPWRRRPAEGRRRPRRAQRAAEHHPSPRRRPISCACASASAGRRRASRATSPTSCSRTSTRSSGRAPRRRRSAVRAVEAVRREAAPRPR